MTDYIKDKNGNPILKLNRTSAGDRVNVSTPSGETLGSIHNGNTYDRNGNLVVHGEAPTILRDRNR